MKKSRQYLVDSKTYFATPYKGGPRPKLFGVWSEKRNRQLTGPCIVTKPTESTVLVVHAHEAAARKAQVY